MATVVNTLVMKFGTTLGETVTFSYKYVKSNMETITVQDLADGIIANGSIFASVPVIARSAKLVTTTESEYELDA